jgi:hypothetical protein
LQKASIYLGDGEMSSLIRQHDWSDNLGALETWSPVLRSFVALMMAADQPMFLAWGPQRAFLYNDAFIAIAGRRHPQALGTSYEDGWGREWSSQCSLTTSAARDADGAVIGLLAVAAPHRGCSSRLPVS